MIFNSIDFAIFFVLVFFSYWLVFRRTILMQNIFIVAVSYLFYGWWDWRFLSLILISSLVDYTVGKHLFTQTNEKKRKRLLLVTVGANLGLLGFFKYYNFFADSFINAFAYFGVDLDVHTLNIILPVGISFYTFQTLSYTLDIYYRRMEPARDLLGFMAFVSFFPQLVAGPIERAKHLLPQFYEKKSPDYAMLKSGLLLMAWGFFKKIVIADRLARYVDASYQDVNAVHGAPALVAAIFFAFQLYLDFSAYSDIAIGSARTLGFDLSPNFKRPYLSSTFGAFWQRWHISLSSWFRDYLYIPLGGNRKGTAKMIRNIMIVFLLSGLWHGASWNFVIWGGINGLFIIVLDKLTKPLNKTILGRIASTVFVVLMWSLSLVFFRAQTLPDALHMIGNIGTGNTAELYNFGIAQPEFKFTIFLLIALVLFEILQETGKLVYDRFAQTNFIFRWAVYLSLAFGIILLGSYGIGVNDSNFIYFQF